MPPARPLAAANGTNPLQDVERLKREAARRALDLVRPGMRLGLGTGSTARHFVDLLGERVGQGFDVICVPTSEKTRVQAEALGVRLTTLDETPELDLVVDGADEIDRALRLIKGGGGALLREKIVAAAASRMVVIADDSKLVDRLGAFPLPVEVVPFGLESTRRHIAKAAAGLGLAVEMHLRAQNETAPFITDGGHNILDCAFGAIGDPAALSAALQAIPGVVDHGLFIGMAQGAILASANGVRILGELA